MKCAECCNYIDDLVGDGGIGECSIHSDDHLFEYDKEIVSNHIKAVYSKLPKGIALYPYTNRDCKYFKTMRETSQDEITGVKSLSGIKSIKAVCKGLGIEISEVSRMLTDDDVEDVKIGNLSTKGLRFAIRTILVMEGKAEK